MYVGVCVYVRSMYVYMYVSYVITVRGLPNFPFNGYCFLSTDVNLSGGAVGLLSPSSTDVRNEYSPIFIPSNMPSPFLRLM